MLHLEDFDIVQVKKAKWEKQFNAKSKVITIQGNETMDGQVNWESSTTSDADRFAQGVNHNGKVSKTTKSFDVYLERKKTTAIAKKIAKNKVVNFNLKSTS